MTDSLGRFEDYARIPTWWFSGENLEYVIFKKVARNESILRCCACP